jgi:hypothetical protein
MMGAVTVIESGDADETEQAWQIKALRHGVDVMYGITSGLAPAAPYTNTNIQNTCDTPYIAMVFVLPRGTAFDKI